MIPVLSSAPGPTAVSAGIATPVTPAPAVRPLASTAIFDGLMEAKTAALVIRDDKFSKELTGSLKPEHFSSVVDRNLVFLAQDFLKRYGALPGPGVMGTVIRTDRRINPAEHTVYLTRLVELYDLDLREREFVRENVIGFCRRQQLLTMAAKIPDLIDKADLASIKGLFDSAMNIGEASKAQFRDYFAEAEERKKYRESIASGAFVPGVSTGFPEIDREMYHKGWGRRELSVIMAPSKRGKTAFMLQSAAQSVVSKSTNALYISLEVDEIILGDRLDAMLTSISMGDLVDKRDEVAFRMGGHGSAASTGKLWLEQRPSNSFNTDQLEVLIQSYLNSGRKLDEVFVDYIGIMRLLTPDDRYIGLGMAAKDLRRIADIYNVAMITGAQTNRDAIAKQTSGMDAIGESYAIVQDCDFLMSINANEAELASGVRRLHWAASRNNASLTIKVHGDLDRMQLIQSIIEVSR